MSEAQSSGAMNDLVLFMTALAIAGTIIALAYYFAVALPIQHAAIIPPANIL